MLHAGTKAPGFELAALNGGRRSLVDLLASGPVVLVFFKVSCPTCQLAMPFVDRIVRAGGRLETISQDDAKNTRRFNQMLKIEMDMLLDAKGYPVSNAYGIESVPTFFDISADGIIQHSFSAFVKHEMEALGQRYGIETFRAGENVPVLKPG